MTIFDIINDVLFKKKGDLLERKESEAEFQPYMIQRWTSMYSKTNVRLLNATINKLGKCLDRKSQWYKIFLDTLPKSRYKRISYIKKTSSNNNNSKQTDDAIAFIAKTQQISRREVTEYIKEHGLDISSIVNTLKEQ